MTPEDQLRQYTEQQQLIDALVDGYTGQPVSCVVAALRSSFDAHGLPCPPPTWLTAVAVEASLGHSYVVSGTVTPLNQEAE